MKFLKSKLLWVIVAILISGVAYILLKSEPKPEYTTEIAIKQDLKQTVSVTGSVKGADEIELNFEASGILEILNVKKGDEVKSGDVLAGLSATNQSNAVLEARANLQAAQATLNKLIAGASLEDIAVSQEGVKQAKITYNNRVADLANLKVKLVTDEKSYQDTIASRQVDLNNSKSSVLNSMSNELFNADTALSRIKDILEDDDAKNTLGAQDSIRKSIANDSYDFSLLLLATANNSLSNANVSQADDDINIAFNDSISTLVQVGKTLSHVYAVLVSTPASTIYTETEINTDKTNIKADQATISASLSSVQGDRTTWNSAQSSLQTAQNNLSTFLANKDSQVATAEGAVISAKSSWDLSQAQLTLKKAPARQEDISLQRARVAQAQASLSRAQATLNQMIIKAPVNGLVTRVNYEIGEKTELGKAVIAILGESGLEIEVDIPESDIAKIALNQEATITLDAFGDDQTFAGHVTNIDPAETVISDVVYYQLKVTFDNVENNIKPGMTANIDIITATKEDVLAVPARAVRFNGGRYVEVLNGSEIVRKDIMTGLKADGGLLEVIGGLEEGEKVITFKKELK